MRIIDWSSDVCSSDLSYGLIMARIGTEPEDVLQMVHAKLLTPNRMRFVTMLRRIFPKADERAFARAVSVTIAIMGGVPANYSHRSEEHKSELQSLMRISYAVFCLKKKNKHKYLNNNSTCRSARSLVQQQN